MKKHLIRQAIVFINQNLKQLARLSIRYQGIEAMPFARKLMAVRNQLAYYAMFKI